MKITYAELIKAPRAEIQALVADVEKHPLWLESCTQASWDSEAQGLGATFSQTTQGSPHQGLVAELEEGRVAFSLGGGQAANQFLLEFDFDPVSEDVTRLTFTMTLGLRGRAQSGCLAFLFRFLKKGFEASARDSLQASFQRLKTLAERR